MEEINPRESHVVYEKINEKKKKKVEKETNWVELSNPTKKEPWGREKSAIKKPFDLDETRWMKYNGFNF